MSGHGLYGCDRYTKWLYTSFLLLMGTGYLMALVYLYTSHAGHDGKPGLSVEDIADNYYGNRSGTRLEAALRGPMAGYIGAEDRHHVIEWIRSGAPEAKYATRVLPVLEKTCLACHRPGAAVKAPDLTSYAALGPFIQIDMGTSLHSLMRISHIHLFGIGLILFGVGSIFRRAQLPAWLGVGLLVLPFAAIFVDIAAWFLAKRDPVYAYVIVIAGAVLGAALAAQILIALYQLWFRRPAGNGEMP